MAAHAEKATLIRTPEVEALRTFACGAMGGMLGTSLTYPMDTLKLRAQIETRIDFGSMRLMGHIFRTEGVAAFYRGMTVPVMTIPLVTGTQFSIYNHLKASMSSNGGPVSIPDAMVAGMLTGWAVSFVVCPIELVKVQMQANINKRLASPWDTIRTLARENGVFKAAFSGLPLTLVTRSFFAFYFGAYECVHRHFPKKDYGMFSSMLAGGSAGCAFWLTCYPFDVFKNQIQSATRLKGTSSWQAMRQCMATHASVKSMYRGLVPCLLRSFPTSAVAVLGYELLHAWTK